jgi:hypothetical protein
MRMIFEEKIEHSDFLELILTSDQAEKLIEGGLVQDFPLGLYGDRNLNVFIRIDEGDEDAISKRSSCQIQERLLGEYLQRDGSGKTSKTSRSNRI